MTTAYTQRTEYSDYSQKRKRRRRNSRIQGRLIIERSNKFITGTFERNIEARNQQVSIETLDTHRDAVKIECVR